MDRDDVDARGTRPDDQKPNVTRSRSRQLLRLAAILASSLIALVFIGLIAIHTPPARRFVLAQVSKFLATEHIAVNIDDLRYNLFNLSLRIHQVEVRSTDAPEMPAFLTLGNGTVHLSLTNLLRRRYVVDDGSADDVSVHYFVAQDGTDNVPRPPRDPDQPSEPLEYLIASFHIRQAHVRYENQQQHIDAVLPVRILDVSGSRLTDRHDLHIEADGGHVHAADRDIDIMRVIGDVSAGDDDLGISQLAIDGTGGHVDVKGSVRDFKAPQLDLNVSGHLDAATIATLARVEELTGGAVDVTATVRGTATAPTIDGQLSGSELSARDIEHVQLSLNGTYDIAGQRGSASKFEVRGPIGTVTGSGSVSMADRSQVQFEASSLDVAALMRAAKLPYAASTRIDARGHADWPGLEYLKAEGEAAAVLTPTANGPRRGELPVGGRVDVVANAGRVRARLGNVVAAGANVSGTVTIDEARRLTGDLRSTIADLSRPVGTAEAVLGRRKGSLLPVTIAGPLVLNARLGGSLTLPRVAAQAQSSQLAVNQITGITLHSDLNASSSAVMINSLDLAWEAARAHASGQIGLEKPQRLDLALQADAVNVTDVLIFAEQSDIPASGTFALTGSLSGTVDRPLGSFALRGTDLAAYSETLGSLTANAVLQNREVIANDVVLQKPQLDGDGRLVASIRYGLDDRAYSFDTRSENVKLTSLTLPDGRQVRGDVQLQARGAGTIDAPEADLDLTVASTQFDESDFGSIAVNAHVANQKAVIQASAERFGVSANGTVGTTKPYEAIVDAKVTNLDLASLPLHFETPITGRLNGSATARGNLAEPRRGEASATVDAFTGTWKSEPFQLESPARFNYADETLQIDRLQIRAQDSSVAVNGTLPLRTKSHSEAALNVEAHANLATLVRYAPVGMNLTGEGALDVTGSIRGTISAVRPDLAIRIDRASLASPAVQPGISNLILNARVAEGAAHLDQLTANWGTATIEGGGIIPLSLVPQLPDYLPRDGGPAQLKLTVQNLDAATVPGAPSGLTGHISLNVDVAADSASLAALNGRIVASQLELAVQGLTLAQSEPSEVRIAGGAASIERFDLSGTIGKVSAQGRAGLTGDPLDVRVTGDLNAAAIGLFTDAVRIEGDTWLDVTARGSVKSPELAGFVQLTNGALAVDEPRISAEWLSGQLDLSGNRIALNYVSADVNGGGLEGFGSVAITEGRVNDVNLQFSLKDFAFDTPLDLRSISDSQIRVASRGEELLVDGQVTIQEAGLTGDINFDTGLLSAMTARRKLELTESRNRWLERMRFSINVNTATPILVDDNLAHAEVNADVRVLGTPYETGLSGRLTIEEGAEITLNERKYQVDRGEITFVEERRIYPSFDLQLSTTAGSYDVNISMTGTPDKTETTLTSDPELPEPDIMALLVTGRTLDEMRGEEYEVAREQVLSYLTGRVGSKLGRKLEKATGLSEVRIEPTLIANEVDPGARFTVGQDLTDKLKLTYSTNLADSSDQVWVAQYDITRRFQAHSVRQADNSYRTDFRHDLRFGGSPAPHKLVRKRPKVAAVTVNGGTTVSETELRKMFRVKEGDSFDFFAARKGVTRVEEALRDRNLLQSRVRLRRTVEGERIDLALQVSEGPIVDIQFDGMLPPGSLRKDVRLKWHQGVFDSQRAEDGVDLLRAWLMGDHYLQSTVTYDIEDRQAAGRRVIFHVTPGTRSSQVMLVFQGASGVEPKVLDEIISEQGLERKLFTDPFVVTGILQKYYREQGYLSIAIDKPRYEFQGDLAKILLDVNEGPRFVVSAVAATGNAAIDTPTLLADLGLKDGDPFLPAVAEIALDEIRSRYWRLGYNEVHPDYVLGIDREAGAVDVTFSVAEGRRSIISDISIAGNDRTSDRLVRGQLTVDPQQPLDLSTLGQSRKNLYDTGAFSIVDITRRDVDGGDPASKDKPVDLDVSVREVQPFQLTYGASYDTERGVGGILDISSHNVLGRARVVGLRSRYDGQVRELRGSVSQPSLLTWPVQTTGAVYYRQEINPATETFDGLDVTRKGVSIQQEVKLRNSYVWNYGYKYEHVLTLQGTNPGPQPTLVVAPLTSSFVRDSRDEVLDATRGGFTSHSLAYSSSWLGADEPFIKYFGQYFKYIRLQPERRKRLTNEIIRPRFVYAGGVRIGLARGLGGIVPLSERFFAGGSTTLRGFGQNTLRSSDGISGGQALLVINNELRVPLISIVDGVAFADLGNVYDRISDLSLSLRKTAGVGLRLRTPWFLLRGDYGFVLDRRAGEPRSRVFFSIGQAF